MSARKIIIDTDPGQDDAVAILLALASDEVDLLALTCVAGNVPLGNTTRNARKVCELAGRPDLAIYAGCDAPLSRPLLTAAHIHGDCGLEGPDLPDPTMALADGHAVDYLIDTLRTAPAKTITLCPIGPLTNIAAAFNNAPDIIEKVQEIVLMGGAHFAGGNVTPAAEFNIYVDPEAADIVFRSGAAITVVPLDATYKALITPDRNAAFAASGSAAGLAVAQLTSLADRGEPEKFGQAGAPLHDPCTIAYLIAPDLFRTKDVNVMVETKSDLTLGCTVMDWWHATNRPPNARVVHDLDADALFDLLTTRIARL